MSTFLSFHFKSIGFLSDVTVTVFFPIENCSSEILLISLFLSTSLMAAGSDSSSDTSKDSLYDDAVKLVKRAGKLEKKEKLDIQKDPQKVLIKIHT